MKYLYLLLAIVYLSGCISVKPKVAFESLPTPVEPDYSNPNCWAALPEKIDSADLFPTIQMTSNQLETEIDVFFLHPTGYTGKKGEDNWNGNVYDEKLNHKTDNSSIKFQASIFNAAGKIYAPRYRQAHLHAYHTKDKKSAMRAFGIAYEDVRKAFQYYLKNKNNGRPIILASHSQGTNHAIKLIEEFFDDKPLMDQLVVAYLAGMPVTKDTFKNVKPCQTEFDTGCFCSWRTFKTGYKPKKYPKGKKIVVTNPLTWKTDEVLAPKSLNIGGTALKFYDGIIPEMSSAQGHNGILWASKPKFPGSIFLMTKNYHIGDFNLFYSNVRQNATERSKAFLTKKN